MCGPRAPANDACDALAKLVVGHADLTLKGKKTPYTSMTGNMFSFIADDGRLCLRLSTAGCDAFNQAHGTGPVLQYNRVMRDYVTVPDALLADSTALSRVFDSAVANARTLKPKPTRR
ncbi:MAG: TfoX/Sxy family protein [Alphaproteobacteria bacterium]